MVPDTYGIVKREVFVLMDTQCDEEAQRFIADDLFVTEELAERRVRDWKQTGPCVGARAARRLGV
ncbi:hypothetical protein GCM10027405_29350 [Arthrobacter alkaliphilus]